MKVHNNRCFDAPKSLGHRSAATRTRLPKRARSGLLATTILTVLIGLLVPAPAQAQGGSGATETTDVGGDVTLWTGRNADIQQYVNDQIDTLGSTDNLFVSIWTIREPPAPNDTGSYYEAIESAIDRGVDVQMIVEAEKYDTNSSMRNDLGDLIDMSGVGNNGDVEIRACWAGCEKDSNGGGTGLMHDKSFWATDSSGDGLWAIASSANGGGVDQQYETAMMFNTEAGNYDEINDFMVKRWAAMWWTARGNSGAGIIASGDRYVYSTNVTTRASQERAQGECPTGAGQACAAGGTMTGYQSEFDGVAGVFDFGGSFASGDSDFGWNTVTSGLEGSGECQEVKAVTGAMDSDDQTFNFIEDLRRLEKQSTCDVDLIFGETTKSVAEDIMDAVNASNTSTEEKFEVEQQWRETNDGLDGSGRPHAKFLALKGVWAGESATWTRLWVGSANFYNAAYESADELIFRFTDKSGAFPIYDALVSFFSVIENAEGSFSSGTGRSCHNRSGFDFNVTVSGSVIGHTDGSNSTNEDDLRCSPND